MEPAPTMTLRKQSRDGGGGYQVESFFDVFLDAPPIDPESFFDIFTRVEPRTPGGTPLPLRADVLVEPHFVDSFFDVFFEIDLGGGAFNSNQLRFETNPLQPIEFKSARHQRRGTQIRQLLRRVFRDGRLRTDRHAAATLQSPVDR